MLSRRDLITSGAVFTQVRPDEPSAAQAPAAQRAAFTSAELDVFEDIRDAIRVLRNRTGSEDIRQIREAQRAFLKMNHRFPDCIDVGIQVWERLHMWHVENQQEMRLSRTAEGRLQMEFMTTALILRADVSETLIGPPYDR
jgi:hypothetical protein